MSRLALPAARRRAAGWASTVARRPAAALPLIVIVTALAFLPVLGNDFVNFDDYALIVDNPFVQQPSWKSVASIFSLQIFTPHYKPLVYLSWMVEHSLFGPSPLAFHLDNLALHLANTALVFLLILGLGRWTRLTATQRFLAAGFTSLLFGVHPLRVESVAWAVERKDVLFCLFYLLALLAYLSYARGGFRRRRLVAAGAGLYLLAVLAKGMAITFVAVPFLVDGLARRKPRWSIRDKLPFVAVFLAACFLYGLPNRPDVAGGLGELARAALVANFRFLAFAGHLLVPARLSVIYPAGPILQAVSPWLPVLPGLTLLAAIAVFRWRDRSPLVVFGCLFFAVTISPALAVPPAGSNFLPDRYTYLPALGLLLAAVYLALRLAGEDWRRPTAALAALALVCGLLSFQRVQVWRDSETLWSDAIEKYPEAIPIAHVNRGNHYFRRGDYAAALADYQRALELDPTNAAAHKNRGAVFARRGDLEAALAEFETALALEPSFIDAYLDRGMVRTLLGRFREAENDYERYLSVVTLDARGYFWRGLNHQALGRHRQAVEDLGRALELRPGEEKYRVALGTAGAALAATEGAGAD